MPTPKPISWPCRRQLRSRSCAVRYQGVRADDVALRERLKALAQERRRFGYRRLHVLLRREGHTFNRKRGQRLYREERLTGPRRGGRKRALGTRRPMVTPLAADQRWSLDFVHPAGGHDLPVELVVVIIRPGLSLTVEHK